MVYVLTETAASKNKSTSITTGIKRTIAVFYLFQSYLSEFSTALDNHKALHWLMEAATDHDSHEEIDYLAQAWFWRIGHF